MDPSPPIVRHPAPQARTPVLVSVPHSGTRPLPGVTADDYREPGFETFAYGFAAKVLEEGAGVVRVGARRLPGK